MDAPDWYSSLNKRSCLARVVQKLTYNGLSLQSYAGTGFDYAITSDELPCSSNLKAAHISPKKSVD